MLHNTSRNKVTVGMEGKLAILIRPIMMDREPNASESI